MRSLIGLLLLLFLSAQSLALTAAYPCGEASGAGADMHHGEGQAASHHAAMPCCEEGDPAVDPQAELCQLTCAAGACSSATTLESSPAHRLAWSGVASPPVVQQRFSPSPPSSALFRPPISG